MRERSLLSLPILIPDSLPLPPGQAVSDVAMCSDWWLHGVWLVTLVGDGYVKRREGAVLGSALPWDDGSPSRLMSWYATVDPCTKYYRRLQLK